jgi:D-alanine-D-alanine ligase
MSPDPIIVAIVYGGRSAEHDVSLRSAASVFEAVDKERYHVIPVFISQEGAWYRRPTAICSFQAQPDITEAERLIFSPDPAHKGFLVLSDDGHLEPMPVDVVFPVLHGTYGEDGTLQGLLDMADMPYVGCGCLASAVGMDKVLMKGAFRQSGLEVGPFFWFLRRDWRENREAVFGKLSRSRFPVFVKPANLGSSVGITRVVDAAHFASRGGGRVGL